MSTINDEINRITLDKENIRNAIEAKGVAVPTTVSLDEYGDKIMAITNNITYTDTVTVVFNWIDQNHQPKIQRDVIQRNGSVTFPAGFTDNVPEIVGQYPALNYTGSFGIPSSISLSSVPCNLVISADYEITSALSPASTYALIVIDNRTGPLTGTLNIQPDLGSDTFNVDWGDGTTTNTSPYTHTYATGGVYYIKATSPSTVFRTIGYLWTNGSSLDNALAMQVKRFYVQSTTFYYIYVTLQGCYNIESIMVRCDTYSPSNTSGLGGLTSLKYVSRTFCAFASAHPPAFDEVTPAREGDIGLNFANQPTDDGGHRYETVGAFLSPTTIGAQCCAGQRAMKEMPYIAGTLTTIEAGFFMSSGLQRTYPLPSTVTSIGSNFMPDCAALVDATNVFSNLTNSSISGSLDNFMRSCISLKYMDNLPKFNVAAINGFFCDCSQLRRLPTIRLEGSGNIQAIDFFGRCRDLEEIGNEVDGSIVAIDSGILQLGRGFCTDCRFIKHLYKLPPGTIFDTITGSFCNSCYCLQTVDLRGQSAGSLKITENADGTGGKIAFNNCYSLRKIYVDAAQEAAYKALGYGWDRYYNIIEGI